MKFKTLAILTILPILFFSAFDSKSDKNQKTTINSAEKQFSLKSGSLEKGYCCRCKFA